MKKRMMILAVIAILITGGIFMYRHFVTGQIVDGPGMINTAAPMLELLNAEWMSEDGIWSARIDGHTLDLSYQQDLVYSGNFFFSFDGDDLNVKTELHFYYKQFESEDGSGSSTIESLYMENCRMYLNITVSKEGEDSMRQQAVLDRAECGKPKPAEIESEKIQEVSENAELVEFFWHQNAMSYGDCFTFQINAVEQENPDPRLYCSYTDWETLECVEVGDECDREACPPVPLERWKELADFLREAELSAYCTLDPNRLDATDSKIQVTWLNGEEQFTSTYDGTTAHDLLKMLQDIAGEAYRKAVEEPEAG